MSESNLIGKTFNRLTIISVWKKGRRKMCNAVCTCGTVKSYRVDQISGKGSTFSCGCYLREVLKRGDGNRTHGMSSTNIYRIWSGINQRCTNPKRKSYLVYGGAGIKVCERWSYPDGFLAFMEDMGPRPSKEHSVDRIDNNGNYEPGNCRWATSRQQRTNKKNSRKLTHNGVTMNLIEWAEKTGIPFKRIWARIDSGWDVSDALTIPLIPVGQKRVKSCE